MRVYLAGPMRGYEQFNFPAFHKASAALRAKGFDVFNPAERDEADGFDPLHGKVKTLAEYMAVDLPEVCSRDAIVVMPGYDKSEGTGIELGVATALGKAVITLNDALCEGFAAKPLNLALKQKDAPTGSGNSEQRMTDATTGGQKGIKLARFDLVPARALWALAEVYGKGAVKYEDDNWRRGYPWRWSFGALMRHAWAWFRGEDNDPESGLPHLAHAAWHCFTLMEFGRLHPDKDDRFKK